MTGITCEHKLLVSLFFLPPPSQDKSGTIKDLNFHEKKISCFIFKAFQLGHTEISIKRKHIC